VTDVDLDGEDLYLLVNKGTPRGRLVKTSAAAPNLATAAVATARAASAAVVFAWRSLRNTSDFAFVSPATRFEAKLVNTT